MSKITSLKARPIADSRGQATIEVTVTTEAGIEENASVPSGASKGKFEAHTVNVNDAVNNVQGEIFEKIKGMEVTEQEAIDRAMIELDNSENKSRLGANSILGVSLACARAAAKEQKVPLYEYIRKLMGDESKLNIPTPMLNVINGGKHAKNNIDFQEFMLVPKGVSGFSAQMEAGKKIFDSLEGVLKEKNLKTEIGDEGGYAPDLDTNEMAFGLMVEAINKAGYNPGTDVFLGLDVAASSLPPTFQLTDEMYLNIINMFPVISLEDPLPEEEWEKWAQLKIEIEHENKTGRQIYLIGDDLFVTNPERLKKGVNEYVANAILIKLNQIGTLTETLEVIKIAKAANYVHIVSHRSGETKDTFIADLAVGTGAAFIKAGAPNSITQERIVKYQRVEEIAKEIGA